jgi:hypothetical protein
MRELTIVSPHRDDVPFSLSLALSRWRCLPIKLQVLTVFTVSVYAPRAGTVIGDSQDLQSQITSLRQREDRRVFNLIEKDMKLEALGFLDAPLRLGIGAEAVCHQHGRAIESQPEVELLSRHFRKYFIRGLVLAPLALGDHVDHLTVRTAAIESSRPQRLGFYEDLPYATWVPEPALRKAVSDAEHRTGVPLRGCIIRRKHYIARKRNIIGRYQSQVGPNDTLAIARFGIRYGGGERIWIPKHSKRWRSIV